MTDANQPWDGLTIRRTLPIGVLYAGTRHKDFELRVALAGDLVKAQMRYPEGPYRLMAVDLLRLQLLKLGAIPPEALTTELLCNELTEIDMAALEAADKDLGKSLAALSDMPRSGAGD